ncbi:MAG: hypothetical protein IPQ10_05985 [Saprospiraceae bacterium]|nr:hypothetical protein [Saprospiraceae bacterium]
MKNIILHLFLVLLCRNLVIAQSNYVQLADMSGYNTGTGNIATLADEANAALPEIYRSFKVIDFGYYIHNGEQGLPEEIMANAETQAASESPYFLLVGKESNPEGVLNRFTVKLKIPLVANCLSQEDVDIKAQELENLLNNENTGPTTYITNLAKATADLRDYFKYMTESCCYAINFQQDCAKGQCNGRDNLLNLLNIKGALKSELESFLKSKPELQCEILANIHKKGKPTEVTLKIAQTALILYKTVDALQKQKISSRANLLDIKEAVNYTGLSDYLDDFNKNGGSNSYNNFFNKILQLNQNNYRNFNTPYSWLELYNTFNICYEGLNSIKVKLFNLINEFAPKSIEDWTLLGLTVTSITLQIFGHLNPLTSISINLGSAAINFYAGNYISGIIDISLAILDLVVVGEIIGVLKEGIEGAIGIGRLLIIFKNSSKLSTLVKAKILSGEARILKINGAVHISENGITRRITEYLFAKGVKIGSFAIQNVKHGSGDKIAIIGRSMDDVVSPAANILHEQNIAVELFTNTSGYQAALKKFEELIAKTKPNRVSEIDTKASALFKMNEEWIKKLLYEGYTIIDMGNPLGKHLSFFYEMEKSLLGFK